MNIQIASFALVPDQIYIAEKNYHSDKIILILSDENKIEAHNKTDEKLTAVISSIDEITDFYRKLNTPIEKLYVNYKNLAEIVMKLIRLLNKFSEEDQILLNLSGGRRSIPIALIYASTIVSNYKNININCVVIPEDKTYRPFSLLPQYKPDEKDVVLLSKLPLKKSLTDLEKILEIKQPAISLRLKRLEKFGYVVIDGRNRELTNLGQLLVEIHA